MAVALFGMVLAPGAFAQEPLRVILFIGDGVGASYWTAARFNTDALAVAQMPVGGLIDTRSSSSKVTDSAAGATAYSAGIRTFNGAIGVAPDSTPVATVLEVARDRGLATGLVATSSITHATPASFAAHVPARSMEFEIARQLAHSGITVMLGGGLRFFSPDSRPDSVDLLSVLARDHTVLTSRAELDGFEPERDRAVVGLFADAGLPRASERDLRLSQMTEVALAVLDADPDGFFLMVEASQPDWRGHGNEPLEEIVAEMQDYDIAIASALRYRDAHPETLILVVADHETGGLAIGVDGTDSPTASYTTAGHTAQMIPLFAVGPGSAQFGGMHDNYRIGEMLMQIVRQR